MSTMPLQSSFFTILCAFASLVKPNRITLPKDLSLSPLHDFLLEKILLNPHFDQYPPSRQYQKVFWKWTIQLLENTENVEDFEIDSRIYEHYLALLSPPEPPSAQGLLLLNPPEPSYVTYFQRNPRHALKTIGFSGDPSSSAMDLAKFETVTLRESRTTIENGTTGLRTWLASFVLSEYLTKHPGLVTKSRVLELGAGIGFLGAIIASLQQNDPSGSVLWLTDANDDVLSRCRDNLRLPCNRSAAHFNVHYALLDWTDSQHSSGLAHLRSLLRVKIDADIIIGADLTFDPSLVPALVEVLRCALQPGRSGLPKLALIAATVRIKETLELFLSCIQRAFLQVDEVQFEAEQDAFMQSVDSNISHVKIFQITVKQPNVALFER